MIRSRPMLVACVALGACARGRPPAPSTGQVQQAFASYLEKQRPLGEAWERGGERGHNPFPFEVSTLYGLHGKTGGPLPKSVEEAAAFYGQNHRTEGAGVYPLSLFAAPQDTWAVFANTDGDDGYIELYAMDGTWLASCFFSPAHTDRGTCRFLSRDSVRRRAERNPRVHDDGKW